MLCSVLHDLSVRAERLLALEEEHEKKRVEAGAARHLKTVALWGKREEKKKSTFAGLRAEREAERHKMREFLTRNLTGDRLDDMIQGL